MNFQNPSGTQIQYIHVFHDWLLVFLLSISIRTIGIIIIVSYSQISRRLTKESQSIEFLWTLVPSVVLLAVLIPSLRLLYLIDGVERVLSVKATGHQWYWQYGFPDYFVESYLAKGVYRLLTVDHRLSLPLPSAQVLVTAADVLHSWAIPTLGVKADAVPGRVNKLVLSMSRAGVYFGQCSEICGSNHRFMPISLEAY